jgi:hypothetical protein
VNYAASYSHITTLGRRKVTFEVLIVVDFFIIFLKIVIGDGQSRRNGGAGLYGRIYEKLSYRTEKD